MLQTTFFKYRHVKLTFSLQFSYLLGSETLKYVLSD